MVNSTQVPMTPPTSPSKGKIEQHNIPEKGPFVYVPKTEDGLTPLQRHCAYFDRNNDGILTPWDTYASFKDLGYGIFMSILGTALVHFFFSYSTLDTWIPDPFFSIHLKNIQRCVHGSDSGAYNNAGELMSMPVEVLMAKYDQENTGGLTFRQGWAMLRSMRDINDPFGWIAAILEWGFLWVLAADAEGIVSLDAIRGQYDGTLFYQIREQRLRQQQRSY